MNFKTGITTLDQKITGIKSTDIISIYGDKTYGKTLISLGLGVEFLKSNPHFEILFIHTHKRETFLKKFISSVNYHEISMLENLNLAELELKNAQTLEKHTTFKNFKSINLPANSYYILERIEQKINNPSSTLIIIDDLDVILPQYNYKAHLFFQKFRKKYPFTPLIFSYAFSLLGDWISDCSYLLAIRNNQTNHITLEFLKSSLSEVVIPKMGNKIYGIYGQNLQSGKCTCGAVKTYGKIANKHSRYHYGGCDILPLEN